MSASSQSGASKEVESARPGEGISPRERQVIRMIADGLNCKAIASELNFSTKTVEAHKFNFMRKLDLHNVAQIVRYAVAHGIIEVPLLVGRSKPHEAAKPRGLRSIIRQSCKYWDDRGMPYPAHLRSAMDWMEKEDAVEKSQTDLAEMQSEAKPSC
jgi:DNA-binding CsgD family transcriptional regulator